MSTKEIKINGKRYELVLLRVVKVDGSGNRLFELLRDDESIQVENDMQFFAVYADPGMAEKKRLI